MEPLKVGPRYVGSARCETHEGRVTMCGTNGDMSVRRNPWIPRDVEPIMGGPQECGTMKTGPLQRGTANQPTNPSEKVIKK